MTPRYVRRERRIFPLFALFCGLTTGSSLGLVACSSGSSDTGAEGETGSQAQPFALFVDASNETLAQQYFEFIETDAVELRVVEDPAAELAAYAGPGAAWVGADTCVECYEVAVEAGASGATHTQLRSNDALGWQYATTELLEAGDFRFYSPFSTYVPGDAAERLAAAELEAGLREPSMQERGLQLHTLHTIEAYYDFWEPEEGNLERAQRVLDWSVKGRQDYVQWVPLDDIEPMDAAFEAWEPHNRAIIDYAHARGLEVGFNVQLFGGSNLQNAYDLLDDIDATDLPAVTQAAMARFELMFDAADWDRVTFSFGEFLGASPAEFIAALDTCYDALQAVAPGTPAGSKIHLGNYEDLYLEYQGEIYNFYFLATFANAAIVPWVHTVMYYNLYDSAGGAYAYDEFDEHRALLHERLAADLPTAYYPETAYWVAFDVSVPTYMPVYMSSRVFDINETQRLAREGGYATLDEHFTFTSGWEWGFWQNDYVTFRATWDDALDWREAVREMFSPFGDDGATLSQAIIDVGAAQHEALIRKELGAFMAGRDGSIDFGDLAGIYSQPDRPSVVEVAAMSDAEKADFQTQVLDELAALADVHTQALASLDGIDNAALAPWLDEVRDGLEVDQLRLRYVHTIYTGALVHGQGGDASAYQAEAPMFYAAARAVVDRRHANLHYPQAGRLKGGGANATRYGYGYLRMAETLCYWDREQIELDNLVTGGNEIVPACY